MSENNDYRKQRAQSHDPKFKTRREKAKWLIEETDFYKEDMGKWYTVFIRRILPFLVLFVPINNVWMKIYPFIAERMLGLDLNVFVIGKVTPFIVYMILLLLFVAILIFLPRFATFCEFMIAIGFYIRVVLDSIHGKPLVTNAFGYFVSISLGIFIFMKFVFLILEIMYMSMYGDEKVKVYKEGAEEVAFDKGDNVDRTRRARRDEDDMVVFSGRYAKDKTANAAPKYGDSDEVVFSKGSGKPEKRSHKIKDDDFVL